MTDTSQELPSVPGTFEGCWREIESVRAQLATAQAQLASANGLIVEMRRTANAEIDRVSREAEKEIEGWQSERNQARQDQEAAEAALATAQAFIRQVAGCEQSDNQNIQRAKELLAALSNSSGR